MKFNKTLGESIHMTPHLGNQSPIAPAVQDLTFATFDRESESRTEGG